MTMSVEVAARTLREAMRETVRRHSTWPIAADHDLVSEIIVLKRVESQFHVPRIVLDHQNAAKLFHECPRPWF